MSAIVSLEAIIRAATKDDAVAISGLALRSKAHWGYSNDFIEKCRHELTYSASQMESADFEFRICEADGRIVGFYGLELRVPGEAELEALFVDPDMIGKGIGRELIEHAKALAVGRGVTRIIIQGDPNAEAFYLAAGGVPHGQSESLSIPGRFLPLFVIDLKGDSGGGLAVPDQPANNAWRPAKGTTMSNEKVPAEIKSSFVVIDEEMLADIVPLTDTIWADIDEKFGDFAGHSLISSFSFDEDWPTWEIHPHGDEFVCLLSGDADMVFDTDGGEQSIRLNTPGSYVIVPKGTWHTARVHARTSMLFVTPGQGTENREHPPGRNGG